jgi:hypothetical protein
LLDLLIGKRELGKTTLAVSISQFYDTRVIFDPRHMINTTSDILSEGQISGILYELLNQRAEIIIRPKFDKQRAFDEMCQEIYDWLQDNPDQQFCLLLDEARFIEAPEKNQHFEFIVRCTNRTLVAVLITMHGIVDVSTDLRRVADFWVLFRITLDADVDTIRERCGNEIAEKVRTLEPYQYIVWNDSNGTFKVFTDSAKWFVPLNRSTASHENVA